MALSGVRKQKHGQSGADGNDFLRTKRIELRVAPHEYQAIESSAMTSGFGNVAQFLRESGIHARTVDSPFTRRKENDRWLYEINRIGNNLNQIARRLNQGNPVDDEILMILMQIREMLEEVHKAARPIARVAHPIGGGAA